MREPYWDLGQRVKTLRKQHGLTQQEFATRLGVTQPTVHRWEKGAFEPDPQTLEALSELAGMSVAEFRYSPGSASRSLVPVVGYVGAGAEIFPIDDHPVGSGLDMVDAPPGDSLGTVAVYVRGESMLPVYGDGDTLFYGRDPQAHGVELGTCLGRDCVVKVANGPTLVKRVEMGGGRGQYTLVSYNAAPLVNVRLDWASPVRWIKRR
ncbi:MAG: helix-turn-helix transcriptional regulator [Rhodospirillales bacterium]|nr:MAG: helix-turn-helix transcriptional regulator [Rhodospirillales bacterium]